jgi:hypothetical protein
LCYNLTRFLGNQSKKWDLSANSITLKEKLLDARDSI